MSSVTLSSEEELSRLLSSKDGMLAEIESRLGVSVIARGSDVIVQGSDLAVDGAVMLFEQMSSMLSRGGRPSGVEVRYALGVIEDGGRPDLRTLAERTICMTNKGKPIRPYTAAQMAYVDAIRENDITFGIGPAGTGKTYLAAALAVAALKDASASRVVLVRPVVEAGEHLGFLPGDMQEKIDPYLRPLYDAFYDLLSPERFSRYVEKGVIEAAPLAYMRGRTINSSFIILDEAQNTTKEQMKMFLTRLGMGSRAVITGDITQIDLPGGKESGLRSVERILGDVPGIAFCRLSDRDVVRHDIVQRIVRAYEEHEQTARAVAP